MRTVISIMFIAPVLVSCTTGALIKPPLPDASSRAEVVVLRETVYGTRGTSVTFSVDKTDYLSIRSLQYASIFLVPKTYTFSVRVGDVEAATLELAIGAGERRCLKIHRNSLNAIFPVLMSQYYLDAFPCPTEAELSKYERLKVEYQ